MTVAKKRQPNSVKLQKRLFENDCGQKNPNQTVQASKKHFLKMTVAKKTEPNSVRCKMAPCKNDCGQKNPIQAVQVTK